MLDPSVAVKLPHHFKAPSGADIVVDRIKEEETGQVHKLFMKSAEAGDGLSVDEMSDESHFREYCKRSKIAVTVKDASSRSLLAFANIVDAPLCRSSNPISHGGYVVSDPHHRHMKIGMHVMKLWSILGIQSGYRGVLGRTGLLSTGALVATKRNGAVFTGVIPASINLPKKGFVDDQITWEWYPDLVSDPITLFGHLEDKRTENIPPLSVKELPVNIITHEDHHWGALGKVLISHSSDKMTLRLVDSQELMHTAQCLIRELANTGQGFGIDEFDPNTGVFNHRLLKECHYIALQSGDSTAGFVCVGRSAMCRSDISRTMSGYIVLYPQFQNKNIGSTVLILLEQIARQLGFKHVLYDTLHGDGRASRFMLKHRYLITGSLPYCCVDRNIGYETSLVWYKTLVHDARL